MLVRPLHQSGTDAHLLPRRPGGGVAGGVALVVHMCTRGGMTMSRASEINKFMSLLSIASPIVNLSIGTFDS